MQTLIKSLLLALLLVSCGADKDSRYRDMSELERPPTLSSSGSAQQSAESYAHDDSRIEKMSGKKGLDDTVYLTDTIPPQIKIKQPLDKAWNTVERGLKQSNIKITDRERNKAQYHVNYTPSSLFGFLQTESTTVYLLTLKQEGNETTVSAGLAPEQNSVTSNNDGYNEGGNDPEKLLQVLFDTLHNDLKEE